MSDDSGESFSFSDEEPVSSAVQKMESIASAPKPQSPFVPRPFRNTACPRSALQLYKTPETPSKKRPNSEVYGTNQETAPEEETVQRPRKRLCTSANAINTAAKKAENRPELEVNELFTDWGLKMVAKFDSKSSFDWCSEIGMNAKISAWQNVCKLSQKATGDRELDFENEMHYFTYPPGPLDLSVENIAKRDGGSNSTAVTGAEKTALACWKKQKDEWLQAFNSVFELTVASVCPYFYCFFKDYGILFLSAGMANCKELCCVITTSTARLRKLLEENGIAFEMPHVGNKLKSDPKEVREDVTESMRRLEQKGSKQVYVSTARSSDLIRNWGTTHSEATVRQLQVFLAGYQMESDKVRKEVFLPVIYTKRTPFVGATLKRLEVSTGLYSKAKESVKGGIILDEEDNKQSDSSAFLKRYRLKLQGPIFPQTLVTLSKLFEETQEGEFEVMFYPHDYMANTNKILGAAIKNTEDAPDNTTKTEVPRYLREPVKMAKPISKAVFHDGHYDVYSNKF